mgnify:CR=1 FL=1
MPRYVYFCNLCDSHFQVRHGMSETQESCNHCGEPGSLVRVPQMPNLKINKQQSNKTGSITKEYIEKNRELLREMKIEAGSQEYDN